MYDSVRDLKPYLAPESSRVNVVATRLTGKQHGLTQPFRITLNSKPDTQNAVDEARF